MLNLLKDLEKKLVKKFIKCKDGEVNIDEIIALIQMELNYNCKIKFHGWAEYNKRHNYVDDCNITESGIAFYMDKADCDLRKFMKTSKLYDKEKNTEEYFKEFVAQYGYILLQVARQIKVLHSLGIVHNDIKPDNVIVGKQYA